MSEPAAFQRRDFLKLVGIGVAGAVGGCAPRPAERLIPYLVPPKDLLPGVAYWYASTCLECPSGCGLLVKTREGRAIKLEGNPAHPVNRGGLCARGHASLQGLYHPDRIAAPMLKQGGTWKKATWDEAMKLVADKLGEAQKNGSGIAVLTDHRPGSLEKLVGEWAAAAHAERVVYEPFAPHALVEANRRTFGQAAVPHYDFERAQFVLSFGADFLETWLSPAGHARGFSAMRARQPGGYFVAVEPRLSLTGSNADEWLAARAGTELAVALGMVNVILTEGLGAGGGGAGDAVEAFTPEAVEQQTDVKADDLRRIARAFAAARPSLAVAGGIASQSEQSVATIAAVNLLNQVVGNVGQTIRFDRTLNLDALSKFGDLQALANRMSSGGAGVLVVSGANPAYAAPSWAGFTAAMDKVPFKVAIGSVLDETSERCDVLLPTTHWLESLGDAESVRGVRSLVQPTMQKLPMFDARPAGDVFLDLARGAGFGSGMSASWAEYLEHEWRGLHPRFGHGGDFDTFWADAKKTGGVWEEPAAAGGSASWSGAPAFALPELRGAGDLALVVFPTVGLYDGRGADKPWLQELPDPTTKAVWGSWVEMHPETAAKMSIKQGDAVKVETEAGAVEVPVYLYAGIRRDTIAIPLGQGHTSLGRYAKGIGVNAVALIPAAQDAASQSVAYLSAKAKVTKIAKSIDLVVTQREKQLHERDFAQIIPVSALLAAGSSTPRQATADAHGVAVIDSAHGGEPAAHGATAADGHEAGSEAHHVSPPSQTRPGEWTEPRQLKEGERIPAHAISAYRPEESVRHPRAVPITRGDYKNGQHRWAMAIDLDRCTGCSACVTACYAENNIPVVGPEMVKRGREMAWLRIERFDEKLSPDGDKDVRHLPMLCQHCGDAPCEIVCPVYATYHNYEGLNAQIYNRCVGTRYCSNNCPYKVRAFNWFDYSAPEKATFAFPEPLNWQLNPDVTVRSKGVMEKCTFCVQRILEGKGYAKDENRALKDGEIQTACQQSCPSEAIVFGDLLDPESKVAKLSYDDPRHYWALTELNTKPGVTYLKRVVRKEGGSA
jgi:anaerobic selenocysteine-containing dehydrogenase/Fe-S-cluster-containing dehydrogenase component